MLHYDIWMKKYLEKRDVIVKALRGFSAEVDSVKDRIPVDEIIRPLDFPPAELSDGMCFVDGGEGLRETLGAGVYFVRASALYLADGEAEGEFVRDLDLGVVAYDDYTKERVEFLREALENRVAFSCAKKHKPKYVFLDGSLLVKSQRKRIECSEFFALEEAYTQFMDYAEKSGIILVGVSEDSKSRILKRHLEARYGVGFPSFMTDPTILELLSTESTFITAPLTPRKGGRVYRTHYLKPTPNSNPMRIDFAPWVEEMAEALSMLVELSRSSHGYGYPLPLYLAHMDSAIPRKQADWNTRMIVDHALREGDRAGSAVFGQTRRSMRPGERV